MPINTTHAGYDLAVTKAARVRDFAAGEFVVKAKGDLYLPRLGGQTNLEYENYKTRGYIVPAVEPTAVAMIGSITRKPATIESTLEHIHENLDGVNTGIELFVSGMIRELLYGGAAGYLVEWDKLINQPVVKQYSIENIINFSFGVGNDYIVLSQNYTKQSRTDKFKQTTEIEYLELTFDENGSYIQNIWRKTKTGFAIVDTITPENRGDMMDELPFVFCMPNAKGSNNDPILLHLANVNLDQYRLSTDERHGLHWTALPTMFLFGDLRDEEGKKKQIKVGAGSSNHIDDTEARVELLEFSGAGLSSIKAAIEADVDVMASIGAKMLTGDSAGVKAAETARIDASSETATLNTIANTINQCVNDILAIMAEWSGSAGEHVYAINRDFIDIKLDPNALMALLRTMQGGGMSLDTFLFNLKRGELLPKGVTAEDEADRIDSGREFDMGDNLDA